MGGDHSNIILFGLRHSLVLNIKQVQIAPAFLCLIEQMIYQNKQKKKLIHT